MIHNTLGGYYTTEFGLIHHHKYSKSEIEDMIPFERDLLVKMIVTAMREIAERAKYGPDAFE
jgi:hypothetical protein